MEKQIGEFKNYSININGSIYSKKHKRFLNPYKDKLGYFIIDLFKDKKRYTKKVHRLLSEEFIPNPNNLKEVNHIDGNKSNYNISNLEWCDRSSNMKHAFRTGLLNVKHNPLYDLETGIKYSSTKEAAEILGINYGTLKGYINGKSKNKTSLRKQILNGYDKHGDIKRESYRE